MPLGPISPTHSQLMHQLSVTGSSVMAVMNTGKRSLRCPSASGAAGRLHCVTVASAEDRMVHQLELGSQASTFFFGRMTSMPIMNGRSASGITTLPSACRRCGGGQGWGLGKASMCANAKRD